jgi:hypothetical protein
MSGRSIFLWAMAAAAAFIKVFSLFPEAVENYYASSFYPRVHSLQYLLFGWLPFSFGDMLYAVAIGIAIIMIIRFIRWLRSRDLSAFSVRKFFRNSMVYFLTLYVVFNVFWGLNYNRPGVDRLLKLDTASFRKSDLLELMDALVIKVNLLDSASHARRSVFTDPDSLYDKTVEAYATLARENERFRVYNPSIKSSLFGSFGNYLGYTGYYNPFTGEAQVNTAVPLFLQPFTSCHELGHLLGFARENEANFAGYLAARSSPDPAFQYSVYFDMYLYGRSYLKRSDSLLTRKYDAMLDPLVKKDMDELKAFYLRHENPLERIIDRLYDSYLQANQQPEGKKTYSKVIQWLVAYRKKHGEI